MKDIRLADGTLLEVNINFLTVKLLNDLHIDNLIKKLQKSKSNRTLELKVTGKLIYAIIRSNGRKVDEEEAMMLIPLDDEVMADILKTFMNKMEAFKKKQTNKMSIPK